MVRIADVVNSESINLEWQLAGGVTACNLLHGSANPIGGQNAVIKLRLGSSPMNLIMKRAPSGINRLGRKRETGQLGRQNIATAFLNLVWASKLSSKTVLTPPSNMIASSSKPPLKKPLQKKSRTRGNSGNHPWRKAHSLPFLQTG